MKLFISLYLDQDVSVVLAAMLRARKFEVLTTQEANNLGASDKEQLEFAIKNQMAILTHNRIHFEKLFQEYLKEGNKTLWYNHCKTPSSTRESQTYFEDFKFLHRR